VTDRRFGASRDQPIAEFSYRHEAEFAAGFLRTAGIPFRLQVDDAGGADAGVTIGRPAVLWVRAEDVEEAREILELDGPASSASVRAVGGGSVRDRNDDDPERPVDFGKERGIRHGVSGRRESFGGPDAPGRGTLEPLGRGERLVAGLLALALVALASAGGEGAVPWVGLWEGAALLLGLALGLSAVSGRTLASLKTVLRALSGLAP